MDGIVKAALTKWPNVRHWARCSNVSPRKPTTSACARCWHGSGTRQRHDAGRRSAGPWQPENVHRADLPGLGDFVSSPLRLH